MGTFRQNGQWNPPPIPPALRTATGLPLLARTPGAACLSAPPTPSLTAAGVAAVAALWVTGSIKLLASLEQAPPATDLP
jgi:hypothetical protein